MNFPKKLYFFSSINILLQEYWQLLSKKRQFKKRPKKNNDWFVRKSTSRRLLFISYQILYPELSLYLIIKWLSRCPFPIDIIDFLLKRLQLIILILRCNVSAKWRRKLVECEIFCLIFILISLGICSLLLRLLRRLL